MCLFERERERGRWNWKKREGNTLGPVVYLITQMHHMGSVCVCVCNYTDTSLELDLNSPAGATCRPRWSPYVSVSVYAMRMFVPVRVFVVNVCLICVCLSKWAPCKRAV